MQVTENLYSEETGLPAVEFKTTKIGESVGAKRNVLNMYSNAESELSTEALFAIDHPEAQMIPLVQTGARVEKL